MTSNNAFATRTCIVVAVPVVTNEPNMASHFPEAGNFNGSNVEVAGPSSSDRAICLSFHIGQILRTFSIFPATSSTGRHLGFECDYLYHTAFWGVLRHHA